MSTTWRGQFATALRVALIGLVSTAVWIAAAAGDEQKETPKAEAKKAEAKKAEAKKAADAAAAEQKAMQEAIAKMQADEKAAKKAAQDKGSHKEIATIPVKGSAGQTLQTLCADARGRVIGLAAPSRYFDGPSAKATGEVVVFTSDGKEVARWKVPFHAHSINTGPDGAVYVAGDGKVARYSAEGKELALVELPHVAELLKDKDKLREQAEAQVKQQKESMENSLQQIKKLVAKLEEVPEEKRTAAQKRQLQQYEQILKSYEENSKYYASQTVDAVLKSLTSRLRVINGIAVSPKDVFIVCGEAKGYGYAVWRTDHDFKSPKQVLSGLSGCCGQMDVQVLGEDLLVARNTNHEFGRYSRDGLRKGAWGKRGGSAEDGCFGGCCNPMNVRAVGNEVFTAESEGIIKRFSADGEYLGMVGYAPLTGGCKNVAVAATPDGSRVYFCDQPGSRILVLAKKEPRAAK